MNKVDLIPIDFKGETVRDISQPIIVERTGIFFRVRKETIASKKEDSNNRDN